MSKRRAATEHGYDGGAAPVDFVLVGALLTVLFLAVVQLGLLLYVRNVAASAATEGARYAANANRNCADGEQWTRQQLAGTIARTVVDVRCDATAASGVVTMTTVVRVPVLGVIGRAGTVEVRGHALDEHVIGR